MVEILIVVMGKIDDILVRRKTLTIEIEATREQRERARTGYDAAAAQGNQAGMKSHGARFEQCERDLADMEQRKEDLQRELEKVVAEFTPEERERLLQAALKARGANK